MSATHDLKTLPWSFTAIAEGLKTFEIRWNDRAFQTGDHLRLREWDPKGTCSCRDVAPHHGADCARFTGRVLTARIGWVTANTVTAGGRTEFNGNGYVVLALCDVALEGHPWQRILAASQPPVVVER